MTGEVLAAPASSTLIAEKSDASDSERHLFGPRWDMLALGGASLLVLPLVALIPVASYERWVINVVLVVALFVNHPHFANSYQIFYRDFRTKLTSPAYDSGLRARYLWAGVVVPFALAGFFAFSVLAEDVKLLGTGRNLVLFFVGWHYVKQGYGMLMVDSALKQRFFSSPEKQQLRVNAYLCWMLTFIIANRVDYTDNRFFDIHYSLLDLPDELLVAGILAVTVSTVLTGRMLLRKHLESGGLPRAGVVAYVASLYPWMVLIHTNRLFLLVVPVFHSLQYLTVVSRFELSFQREAHEKGARGTPSQRLGLFALKGFVIGLVLFWLAPVVLDQIVPYDHDLFGDFLFLFIFWLFVNAHHYFLDNVMWRRGNPEVREYLFTPND